MQQNRGGGQQQGRGAISSWVQNKRGGGGKQQQNQPNQQGPGRQNPQNQPGQVRQNPQGQVWQNQPNQQGQGGPNIPYQQGQNPNQPQQMSKRQMKKLGLLSPKQGQGKLNPMNPGQQMPPQQLQPIMGQVRPAPPTQQKQQNRKNQQNSAEIPSLLDNSQKSKLTAQMINFNDLPRYLNMATGDMIYLDLFTNVVVDPGRIDFPPDILLKPDLWHQVVCVHNNQYKKDEILDAIFKLAEYNEIFPIGYREYKGFDTFLVTASDRLVIEKIIMKNLTLTVRENSPDMQVAIRMGAGKIIAGQVHPQTQIEVACRDYLEKATLYGNGELNLAQFPKHEAMREVSISMLNPHHFNLIMDTLLMMPQAAQMVKKIKLIGVGLYKLDMLRKLVGFPNLIHLDLRYNQIISMSEFHNLSGLRLTNISVEKNPFTFTEDAPTRQKVLSKCIPTLTMIDGAEFYTPTHVEECSIAPAISDDDVLLKDVSEGDVLRWDISMISISQFRSKYKNSKKWHKVKIHHEGAFTKKEIVQKLLGLIENHDFWACYYSTGVQVDEFFVHNNFDALDILFRNQLTIGNVGAEKVLKIELNMNVADFLPGQIDVAAKIQKLCLDNFINKVLFLDNVQDKPMFQNVIIDMTAPRVLSQILLSASRKCGTNCTAISLNDNGITNCGGMYPLVWFPKLKHLSLANNKIDSFEKLCGIPQANKISSIALDGNPICNVSLHEYVKGLKRHFMALDTLDGMPVGEETFMLSRQNYLCYPEAYSLVEAFITRFFKTYDSNTRHLLKELYADRAMFTVCHQFDQNKKKEFARAQKYIAKARNIARLVDLSHSIRNVFVGPQEIFKAISEMHFTEHDLRSFHIDLVYYTRTEFLVVVTGVLRDIPMTILEEELLLSFRRSFMVRACIEGMGLSNQSSEFKIQNDMLTVKNISVKEKQLAFKVDAGEKDVVSIDCSEEHERNVMLVMFQELTQVNTAWSTRCLEESRWNFKVALSICVKLLEDGVIPSEAIGVR